MSYKYLISWLALGMCLIVVALPTLSPSQAGTSEAPAASDPLYIIEIVPDQMAFSGDVTTHANCLDPTVCSWLDGTPTGTIILGVDPGSPNTDDWDGGSATAEVFLADVHSPTLLVLELSWPGRDGKGLHSPEKNRTSTIALDGRLLWSKRTTELSTFGDYYAAEHKPILTTIVLTQSLTHTLTISVPARTAWDLSRLQLAAYPHPATIKGIGYSPFRDCQYPGGERQPSTENLREDLTRLFHTSNSIRTYSARGVTGQVPALANEIGLPVFAGAGIDGDEQEDVQEIQALIDLACATDLEGAIVGNEYYLRHRTAQDIAYLVQSIEQVRSGIYNTCGKEIPLTSAEIDNLMFEWESGSATVPTGIWPTYRPVLDAVDFVMVHTYPFWNRLPIDGAAGFTVKRYKAIQQLIEQEYPGEGKWVILGEAGWPSGGEPNWAAVASPENQYHYLLEFLNLAEREGVEFLYFDAFDELWKIAEPGRVGQHWGYSYTDRSAKYHFYGVLLPLERLFPNGIYLPLAVRGSALATTLSTTGLGGNHASSPSAIQTSYYDPFPVYTEWPMGPDNYVPSGWMGDIENIDMYECERDDPHSGELSIRVSFSPTGTLGQAGVYWQHPENNWGDDADGGFDLSWASKLTFWAKGQDGGERIRFFVGGIGTKENPYPDSLRPEVSTGFLQLGSSWQEYTVDLRQQDLSRVIGGFGWATDLCANPDGATFYLDDIAFEYDPDMPPSPPRGPFFPIYTDAAAQDNHYFPSGWMGDATVPGRVTLTECWYANPHSGQTVIRIAYTQQVIGWAGAYWLHPAENWGDRPGGLDLMGADRLTFWARSDTPNAVVKFLIGGVGYPNGTDCYNPLEPYPDSVCPKIEEVKALTLSPTWSQQTIDLHSYPNRDLSKVIGGFGWVAEDEVIFYLDDIQYEFDE